MSEITILPLFTITNFETGVEVGVSYREHDERFPTIMRDIDADCIIARRYFTTEQDAREFAIQCCL